MEQLDIGVGVVTGVVGVAGFEVVVVGEQAHAGTTAMAYIETAGMSSRRPTQKRRKDALVAASESVIAIESICAGEAGSGSTMLVCTVGQMIVKPNERNVVPGLVSFSLDIRSLSRQLLQEKIDKIKKEIQYICERRLVEVYFQV